MEHRLRPTAKETRMSILTWKYELPEYKASAVSELGTYRIQGGAGQRWVAIFIPFMSYGQSSTSDVFPATNFATLNEAILACVKHAERNITSLQ